MGTYVQVMKGTQPVGALEFSMDGLAVAIRLRSQGFEVAASMPSSGVLLESPFFSRAIEMVETVYGPEPITTEPSKQTQGKLKLSSANLCSIDFHETREYRTEGLTIYSTEGVAGFTLRLGEAFSIIPFPTNRAAFRMQLKLLNE